MFWMLQLIVYIIIGYFAIASACFVVLMTIIIYDEIKYWWKNRKYDDEIEDGGV